MGKEVDELSLRRGHVQEAEANKCAGLDENGEVGEIREHLALVEVLWIAKRA